MRYLSASTKQFFDCPDIFGCMFNVLKVVGNQDLALDAGCHWMLDNGMFYRKYRDNPDLWDIDVFQKWIRTLENLKQYQETCLGVIIPDVPFKYKCTLRRFLKYYGFAKELGYRVGLATQNGLTCDKVDWDVIDYLFIGGNDEHKLGVEAYNLCVMAINKGKRIHVGRVNSGLRLGLFPFADSVDGTTFCFHPTQQLNGIVRAIKDIRLAKEKFTKDILIRNMSYCYQNQHNDSKQSMVFVA